MKLRTEFTKDPIYQVAIKIDGALDTVAIVKEVSDAEKLVLAYNLHDELLNALKAILDDCTFEKRSGVQRNVNEYRAVAKAIIAKAKDE